MNDSMGQFLTQSHGWKSKWFASDILWEIIQVVFHQIVLSSVLDYLPYIATLSTLAISSACSQQAYTAQLVVLIPALFSLLPQVFLQTQEAHYPPPPSSRFPLFSAGFVKFTKKYFHSENFENSL